MTDGQAAGALDARFCLKLALAMASGLVAGFSVQLVTGRSSFDAPVVVDVHAIILFGWVVLLVIQSWLVGTDRMSWHRKLGWLGALWMAAMIPLGFATTVNAVQMGRVPFFLLPQVF